VPLLAAHQKGRHSDKHCSQLKDRKPWEASSAVLGYRSPFLRREQWHTNLKKRSTGCAPLAAAA
jgi:hypothetical protein